MRAVSAGNPMARGRKLPTEPGEAAGTACMLSDSGNSGLRATAGRSLLAERGWVLSGPGGKVLGATGPWQKRPACYRAPAERCAAPPVPGEPIERTHTRHFAACGCRKITGTGSSQSLREKALRVCAGHGVAFSEGGAQWPPNEPVPVILLHASVAKSRVRAHRGRYVARGGKGHSHSRGSWHRSSGGGCAQIKIGAKSHRYGLYWMAYEPNEREGALPCSGNHLQ